VHRQYTFAMYIAMPDSQMWRQVKILKTQLHSDFL